MKSMILLEIKCPQLSKPEATAATAARSQNSIGDRMEKKLVKNQTSQSDANVSMSVGQELRGE